MTVWQIAAGDEGRGRYYADRFIQHGIAFVGGEKQCAVLNQRVQLGDKVILKRGLSQIVAAGTVVQRGEAFKGCGDKDWLHDFDGWKLESWCYVDWHTPIEPIDTTGLSMGTILSVNKPHLLEITDRILASNQKQSTYLPEPESTKDVSDEDLIRGLIGLGLRAAAAEDLTKALRQIRRLARFYLDRDWSLTNEHDARTFLVVPLLIALGWAEQKIKIELGVPNGGRVDIGCFSVPYDGVDDAKQCVALIETKGLTQGLDYATNQAKKYAGSFPSCRAIFVTNGYCYKAFRREQDTFSTLPTAYLNIDRPRDRYPLDPKNVGGALEVLKLLLPN